MNVWGIKLEKDETRLNGKMKPHNLIVELLYELVKGNSERYPSEKVFKEQKVAELKVEGLKYEPDVYALTHNNETDVYEVWLGQTWEKGVTDLLFSLRIRNLGWINIFPVNMHNKYKENPQRAWKKKDVLEIRSLLIPLLNDSARKSLGKKLRIIEIREDELNQIEQLRIRLKEELSLK